MRDSGQIILNFFIFAIAVALIPVVYLYGVEFFGSELGAQLLVAGLGFVIFILQICLFVLYVPSGEIE
jgi:hypothetical protein